MKKYLFRFLTLAVIVPALASCSGQLEDNLPKAKKHTVYFSTAVGRQATRTGLSIEDGIVTPDWRETNPKDVHVFEMDGSVNALLGEADFIETDDDNLGAHFKASLEEEITIIVTPPSNPDPESDGAKVLRQGSKTFGAVVAKSKKVNDEPVFYIPAEQHPDVDEYLKDPGAEFLVGYSRDSYDSATLDDEGTIVDLYFDRVAALSRIGFSEFQGTNEKVMSVTIKSDKSMTGSVTANAISFGNPNSVTFTPDEGAGVLTLDYGTGVSVTEETFYAYFVSMPGTFDITSIEILTDQYRYTKEINKEGGFEFTLTELKNLKLTGATAEKVTQERVYTKVTSTADLEVGAQYLLVFEGLAGDTDGDGDPKVFKPILATETTFTKGDTNKMDVVISANTISSNDYEACHFTLEAGYYLKSDAVGRYIYSATTSGSGTISAEATASHPLTISFDNGIAIIKNASAYCLVWSTSSHYFSAQSQPSTNYSTGICLYKLDDVRQAQELSFSSENAEYDLYSSTWTVAVPTLSGVQTSATYALSEDSDPEVATVDASTGEVTVGTKTGTVTIVATAAGNSQYKPGSASYTLTVVNNDPNVNVYRKVTSTADLEVGAQYLLVFEGRPEDESADNHNPKVFKPILETSSSSTFTKSTNNALDVVILASTISSNEYEDYHLTLETGYYLKVDKYTKYLYPSYTGSGTNQRGTLNAESSASNALNISFNDGIVQIKTTSGSWYFVWSTSSHYFSASQAVEGNYSTGICLYKLVDDREPQSLSFSPTSATYDLYAPTSFIKPTLSTAYGTVTYSSSNNAIAEVDNSGIITGHMKGTVTITATAAGNTEYKPGSASYELEVIDSTPVTMVTVNLKKATRVSAGKQYVLVSNGKALVRNDGEAEGYDFNSTDLTVSLPSNLRDNLEWTLGTNTDSNNRGNIYDFSNGGYYFGIAMNTSSNTYTYSVVMSQTKQVATSVSMPNQNVNLADGYIYYKGNSKSQYIYYDTAAGEWNNKELSNGTFEADYKTTLYVVDDGTVEATTTYYLASSIEAGKQYLIVSNGKALQNNGGTAAALDVTVSDGTIQLYNDDAATALWDATADTNDGTKINFINDSQYLRRPSSGSTVSIGNKSGTADNNQWYYDADNQRITITHKSSSGTTTTYYLSYSNSSWSLSTSSGNATLYTTDPGSNPGGGDDLEPTTFTYTKISGDANLVTGTYLIVDKTDTYLFNASGSNNGGYSNLGSTTGISKDGSTITLTETLATASEFVFTRSGDNLTIKQVGGTHAGQFMYATANTANTYIGFQDSSTNFVINAQDGNLMYFSTTKSSSDPTEYLYKKSTDSFFKLGGSGKPGGNDAGIYLYKKSDNP